MSYIVVSLCGIITITENSEGYCVSYLLASCYLVPEGEKQQMHIISVSVPAPDTADSQTSGKYN